MKVTGFHVCTESANAPSADADVPVGTRWVCECGANFVYREGFNPAGHLRMDWWPAPALVEQRKPRGLRGLLVRPRQGE
jgi:hypothetical protein